MNRENSFHLLRIILAAFVIVTHSYQLIEYNAENEPVFKLTNHQLGFSKFAVHSFFALSGFLIYQSLIRSSSIHRYLWKRTLRIFPGFWFAITVSIIAIATIEKHDVAFLFDKTTLHYWFHTSILNIQFKIPGVFENNVRQGINGSLWTIPYEFLCYLLIIPIRWIKIKKLRSIILAVTIGFAYLIYLNMPFGDFGLWSIKLSKLVYVGLFFLMGALCGSLTEYVTARKKLVAIIGAIALIVSLSLGVYHFVQFIALPLLVIGSGLFSTRRINKHLKTDYSYGVYLYAFPVQQILISTLSISNPVALTIYTLPISFVLAYISWHLIELRALKLK